jgi:hypothetical protein
MVVYAKSLRSPSYPPTWDDEAVLRLVVMMLAGRVGLLSHQAGRQTSSITKQEVSDRFGKLKYKTKHLYSGSTRDTLHSDAVSFHVTKELIID